MTAKLESVQAGPCSGPNTFLTGCGGRVVAKTTHPEEIGADRSRPGGGDLELETMVSRQERFVNSGGNCPPSSQIIRCREGGIRCNFSLVAQVKSKVMPAGFLSRRRRPLKRLAWSECFQRFPPNCLGEHCSIILQVKIPLMEETLHRSVDLSGPSGHARPSLRP